MDIKRMHEMIEKLSESAECEFAKGIECVDTEEMGKVTDMLKDLAEAMYYRTLTKSMDESDPEARFLICLSVTETADGIMTVTGMQTADLRQREEERGEDMTNLRTGT